HESVFCFKFISIKILNLFHKTHRHRPERQGGGYKGDFPGIYISNVILACTTGERNVCGVKNLIENEFTLNSVIPLFIKSFNYQPSSSILFFLFGIWFKLATFGEHLNPVKL
ncbi:MAG: hypothetical protein WD361_11380, partial [Gracilimonas sp.]